MSSQGPTIAFLGATGGCANSVLVNALRSGANVVAVARTPSRLTEQLLAQNITQEMLSSQLTIVPGNALDVSCVKSALTANRPNHLVSHIVSGLGTRPSFTWNIRNPFKFIVMEQPDVCANGARTLITALEEIYSTTPTLAQQKPKLTFVSNTGVSDGPEDVPFGLRTFYHWVLHVPHMDKKMMEIVFSDNMAGKNGKAAVFSGVVCIRPTLLTGGVNADDGIGHEKIRAGSLNEPAIGWQVSRADVGQWMWVNVVSDMEKRKRWECDYVSLTS